MSSALNIPGYTLIQGDSVTAVLDLSFLVRNYPEAQAWFGEQVLQSCRARMPLKSESLQKRSRTEDDGRKVVFPGPYARFQHGGLVMEGVVSHRAWALPGEKKIIREPHQKLVYSRAEATDHWFEAAKETDKDAWITGTRERWLKR